MTTRDFAFWMQGFFELTNAKEITEEQTTMIKNHLSMCFKHDIDPTMGDTAHQHQLNAIHNGMDQLHGPSPGDGYELDPFHGWFWPEDGRPRC